MNSSTNFHRTDDFHLSEDQIDDFLVGDLSAEALGHLEACDPCQVRVSAASAPIESFRAVTLAWAERRSATIPLHTGSYTQPKWSHRLAWAVGAAALAIGIALPVMHRDNAVQPETSQIARLTEPVTQPVASAPAAASVRAVVAGKSAAHVVQASREREIARDGQAETARDNQMEIARDNQMMKTIDRELDAPVDSSASFVLPAENLRSSHGANTSMQD